MYIYVCVNSTLVQILLNVRCALVIPLTTASSGSRRISLNFHLFTVAALINTSLIASTKTFPGFENCDIL
jgi:hypothetical protein